ncbi:MAG: phospholipid carrier-dependent glycosyltransferase, partial [Micromonosporaceae bacterium]|nr:phospholipid carrier-dependent glycosyltransferase [Micromonosporaceae bacterium]
TVIAAIVRLVDLGRPGHIIFDETYYAPNAYGLLRYGVEWGVPEGGATPVSGAPVLGDSAAYVVHPPLGKWLIGLGEWVFGYDAFGWRVAAAVAGIGSVLLITRIARRLFGSTVLGAAAGLLVALDGMHLVMSRTALLDIFLLFFLVAAFGALLRDRDASRQRWLAALERGAARPVAAVPWWRLAAAGLLGCALAVKWSAVFFLPVFLLLVIVWEVGVRRAARVPRPWWEMFVRETGSLLAAVVIVPVVYLASWAGWLATDYGYLRNSPVDGAGQPWLARVGGSLTNLYGYHLEALRFHTRLDASHPYESAPWQWLLLGRPVAFHWSDQGGCGADSCASTVLLLGTPLLWWSFLPALAVVAWLGLARRDWRAAPILLGAAAGILPWFFGGDRVVFYFYALPSQPFLVLAVVFVLGAVMFPGRNGSQTILGFDRRAVGAVLAGGYVILVALVFGYFYPIYTGQVIPYDAWQARMWLSTWV